MIIEMIGPKGIGKSTTAVVVAERLHIKHYMGQGFHDLEGVELTTTKEWIDRGLSVGRSPGLFAAAARAQGGTPKERVRFALNAARRDRFAARASAKATGVLESGPLNSLFQASASYGRDVAGPLYSRVFPSDIYVRLRAATSVVMGRLEMRGGVTEGRVADHGDWVLRYDVLADEVLARLDKPVVEVDAGLPRDEVANKVILGLRDLAAELEYRQ